MKIAAGDNEYNSQSDAFVCAILSHGEEGVVFGIDAKIEIQELLRFFKGNNCAGLVGKPKIFFIQVNFMIIMLHDKVMTNILFYAVILFYNSDT